MLGSLFYWKISKKYVALFGSLFDDIHIERTLLDAQGVPVPSQIIKVPLEYAPKMKTLARIVSDPTISRPDSILLPRMSFEMLDWQYDGSRKINTVGRIVRKGKDADHFYAQYNPVPYTITFALYVYCKNAEDGTKIIEQILPYFTPDFTLTVQLIPLTEVLMDIPITLNSVKCDDIYDGAFTTRRSLIWTLTFDLKGYFYGPVRHKPIIKFVETNLHVAPPGQSFADAIAANNQPLERVTVQPGMLANGVPTSNSVASVNAHIISVDNTYGYCIDFETLKVQ